MADCWGWNTNLPAYGQRRVEPGSLMIMAGWSRLAEERFAAVDRVRQPQP
jgi:hypothetical protein